MPTKKRLEKKKNIEKLKAAKGSKTIAQCFSYKQDEASNSQSSSLVENSELITEDSSDEEVLEKTCSEEDSVTDKSDEDEDEVLNDPVPAPTENEQRPHIDHRLYDQSKYENIYPWLYYNQAIHGYMCKICDVYYATTACPSGGDRGAWSHKGVHFNENAGKKLKRHSKASRHISAVNAMTNLRITDTLGNAPQVSVADRREANSLYVGKLIRIVHFLARNNLPVKALYPKMIDFLANEMEEPIIKQYLRNCAKNAQYTSHEACDGLLTALDEYLWKQTDERIQKSADLVLFADESSNAARREMLGIFISSYDEDKQDLFMDFISLVEVSSTQSEIVMNAVVTVMKDRDIDIKKTRFSCLDGTNSMSGEHNGLQRRIRNYAPHAIYVNCRCHRLALCFKHLMDDFPWLKTIDALLLGLWKTFHFSSKNRYILREIQEAYGLKALNVIKAAVTRWLSHGAACKRCRERYGMIISALDDIVTRNPKPELIGYRSELLNVNTVLQITFLEDVLSVINGLSMVLQSDHKDFGAVRRVMATTISILRDMASNKNSIHLKSFNSHKEILTQVESFTKQNVASRGTRKRLKVDYSINAEEFHEKYGSPFITGFIGEMEAAFDMSCMAPVESLLVFDPVGIPESTDVTFSNYGNDSLKVAFDFYGNSAKDTYQGRTVLSNPIIDCTNESLQMEYAGYKNYVTTRKIALRAELSREEKSAKAKHLNAEADKRKTKREIKAIQDDLKSIVDKKRSPLTAIDLLRDSVVSSAFPNVRTLLRLYALVPQSEAVVERGFSRMKLIMNDKRTNLDQKSLDALNAHLACNKSSIQ